MTSGQIRIIRVAGDHLTIMEDPHVAHLAATVAELIGASFARTGREG